MTTARDTLKTALDRTGLLTTAAAVRNGLVGFASSTRRAARAPRERRVRASLIESNPDVVEVTLDVLLRRQSVYRPVLARRGQSRPAIETMEANRRLVVGLLDSIGVPFVDLPTRSTERLRVGIRSTDVPAVVAAVHERATPTTYVYAEYPGVVPSDRYVHVATTDPARTAEQVGRATTWGVYEYRCDDNGRDLQGDEHMCEIESWIELDDGWNSTKGNLLVSWLSDDHFSAAAADPALRRSTRPRLSTLADFPVDIVYTWVDGDDPAWQRRRAEALGTTLGDEYHPEAANAARYASRDELRYSLRSIEKYADFVRHVYVVTDQQCPVWLRRDHPRLTVVDHRDIFEDHDALPTFNSHSIEARLHHVPGLSEHYLYLNDDFLFGRRVTSETFFQPNGLALFFPSSALMPYGQRSAETKPVDTAAMNGRELVEQHFGASAMFKMKHAPYAQLRSVHQAIEEMFPEQVNRTVHSRVRHPDDLAIASSLHHHVGFALGRAVPADIATSYVELGDPELEAVFDRLRRRRTFRTLCLNDSDSPEMPTERKNALVRQFLDDLFPQPSSFEITGS